MVAVRAQLHTAINLIYNMTNETDQTHCIYSQSVGLHHTMPMKIMFGILYVIIFMTAFCGNSLVLYVVLMRKHLQNVTNLFICNLAVSDLFVTLTSLWLTPMYGYLGKWIWGKVMCHSVPMIQGAGIFINSLTLTAIAIDRYVVILNPFKKRITIKVCLAIIVSIWLFSLMLVVPYGLHMELYYSPYCKFYVCREMWEFNELQAAYGFVVMALQFGFPFLIIAVCYIRIYLHLNARKSLVQLKSDSALKRKKRLLKMLVLMVTIFGLCWLPFNILNLWRDLSPGSIDGKSYFVVLFLISHLIAMSVSGWNCILYGWMNENFYQEYLYIFSRIFRKKFGATSKPRLHGQRYTITPNDANDQEFPLDFNRNGSEFSSQPVDFPEKKGQH